MLTMNIQSRVTSPWELHFPFFPKIRKREWEKRGRGEKRRKDSLVEKTMLIL